jgi:hypothetical protein
MIKDGKRKQLNKRCVVRLVDRKGRQEQGERVGCYNRMCVPRLQKREYNSSLSYCHTPKRSSTNLSILHTHSLTQARHAGRVGQEVDEKCHLLLLSRCIARLQSQPRSSPLFLPESVVKSVPVRALKKTCVDLSREPSRPVFYISFRFSCFSHVTLFCRPTSRSPHLMD